MDRAKLAWGAGKRTCIGKHIAMLEMSKLIPQLLLRYDFGFPDGRDRCEIAEVWFLRLKNFESSFGRETIRVALAIHDVL